MIINLPKLGPVKFRDDLTPQEVEAQAARLGEKYGFKLPKPQVGLSALAGRGFMRSAAETGIALGDTLPGMVGSALGNKKYAQEQLAEAQDTRSRFEEKYPTQFKSYKDVEGLGDAAGFVAETVGELVPTALTSIIPGLGVGATSARVAGQAAAKEAAKKGMGIAATNMAVRKASQDAGRKGMYGGVFMGSFAQNAPEVFEGIHRETGKFEPGMAALAGGINAVLDSVVPTQVLSQLGIYGRQRAVAELAKRSGAAPKVIKTLLATAAGTAAKEGITESAQEAVGAQAERLAGSLKDVFHPENVDRYKEAFVKGAIGGGVFGTVGGAGQVMGERKELRDSAEAENTLAAQDAMYATAQNPPIDPMKAAEIDVGQEAARAQRQQDLETAFKDIPTFKTKQQQADEYYGEAFKDLPTMERRLQELEGLKTQLTQFPPEDPRHGAVQENIVALQDLIKREYGRQQATPAPQAPVQAAQPEVAPPVQPAPPASVGVVNKAMLKDLGLGKKAKLTKAIEGLDTHSVEGLTKFLQAFEKPGMTNVNWDNLEKVIAQVPPDVFNAAEANLKGIAPVEPVTPAPQQVAEPSVAAVGIPELEGRDPGNVDHVTDLLNLSETVKDRATKQELNKWMDAVPRDVLTEAMRRTEGEAIPQDMLPEAAPVAAPVQQATPTRTQMPETDVQAIVNGLGDQKRLRGFNESERDAQSYFSRFDPDLALESIANDLVYQPTAYRNSKMKAFEGSEQGPEPFFASEKEASTYRGQGGAHAKLAADWVRKNLSPESVAKLEGHIQRYKAEHKLIKQTQRDMDKRQRLRKAGVEQIDREERQSLADELAEEGAPKDKYYKTLDDFDFTIKYKADADTAALHAEAHPVVLDALAKGNITRALDALAESSSSQLASTLARKLRPFMSNVKVITGPESLYDPQTNTISLRSGASEYEILHEAAHAALSHTMANNSHPVTRQINNIFKQVKDSLDGMYGATNPQEFVAEVWSNNDLRKQLSEMRIGDTNRSLWDAFIDAVRKFFGFPPRSGNVLDAVDSMLNEIASTPPPTRTGDSLYAQSINDPGIGEKIYRNMDKMLTSMPAMNPSRATSVLSGLEKLTTAGKALMLRTLNLSALGQVGAKVLGQNAITFADTVNRKAGYQQVLLERTYPLHRRLQKFTQTPGYQAWSTLVHDSTLVDVNPEAARTKYVGSPEKLAQHAQLKARFDKLTPEGKELYRDLFSAYRNLDKELEASLKDNVLESVPDKERAISAYEKIMRELSTIRIEHYAPLYRKGTYWMSYMLNGEMHKPLFETQAERDLARRQVEAQGATDIDMYAHIEEMSGRNIPDGTILAEIVKTLKASQAGDEAIDRVVQMVVKALPESSILKSRQRREGVAGYLDDAALAFDNVSSSTIHQLSNMRYGGQLQRVMKNMAVEANQLRGPANEQARLLMKEFDDRRKYVMHPNISSLAQFASTGSFFYFLAGNVSSAVVNTVQLPLIVTPQLGGTYGYNKAIKALWKAMDLYTHSGFKRNTVDISGKESTNSAMWSLENLVSQGKAPQYANLVNKLRDYGFLQTSTAKDAVTAANQTSSTYGGMTRLHYLTNLAGTFMFHHTERMNREVTAVAAYDLEKDRLKGNTKMTEEQKEAQAIDKAVRAVEFMHGAGHTDTGPSLGHSDLGKVMMVFKRFAFSMYYVLFDTMRRALPLEGNDREGMQMARRQLVGMYGMAAIFAGVKGLPLYWIAEAAYNAMKDDDDEDFDLVVRKFIGDMPFKGPVNYYTNLSIADRVGWTDLIFREARGDKADAMGLSQLVESALGAPYSIVNNMFRAKELASDGHMFRAVETALPLGVRNVLKGGRYGAEGANTLRGDPVMGEIDGYNAAMQVLGFAPADLARRYETNAILKKEDSRRLRKRDDLAKKYYVAYREGDFDTAMEVRDKLFEFGAKYPELGIDDKFLERSVRTRDQISADMYHGITISKRNRAALEELANELDN